MVATRRTSLRLQEKATMGECTLPPITDDDLTPTRVRRAAGGDSATKKSPRTDSVSKAKTAPKRSAKKAEEEPVNEGETLEAKDELAKELFQDATKQSGAADASDVQEMSDSAESDAALSSASAGDSEATEDEAHEVADSQSAAETAEDDETVAAATMSASAKTSAAQKGGPMPIAETPSSSVAASVGDDESENNDDGEEEEEEIVMVDSNDGEEESDVEEAAKEAGEEEDIAAYVMMAASGLNLSTSKTATPTPVSTAASTRAKLVPDTLDSGASQHATYFEFQGHAKGAKLMPEQRTKEEQSTLRSQLHVVGHSQRQRAEHQNKKSAGRKWFDMESQELTAEARRDFALLRMRNYLDPKKFYKTSDHSKKLPKHFQMGVVIEGAHEFKSARLTKKERQQTFTDEIMADSTIQTYTKRVFGQIQASRSGQGKKKAKKPRY